MVYFLKLSGFPANGDKKEWQQYRKMSQKLFESVEYNEWLVENGYPAIPQNKMIPRSPFLNIYAWPQELDYTDIRPMPEKCFRIDSFMRKEEEELELPQNFIIDAKNNSQKLIYLSMGSMGSVDVNLMKKLVTTLAKSPHKFIVSKGLLHDKYELPNNMWGQSYVPQTKVLPLVDLVISHAGTNTVTESFCFGKPLIAMPLFGDQYDNAQRLEEKGYGVRLEPYDCTEEELLSAIEKLLNDEELKTKLSEASKRISSDKGLVKAAELVEKLVVK